MQRDSLVSPRGGRLLTRLVGALILGVSVAIAEVTRAWCLPAPAPQGILDAFYTPADPQRFSLLTLGGGYVSSGFSDMYEGVQAEQSVTQRIGVVGRILAYQIFKGRNVVNPLDPGDGQTNKTNLNFFRFEGGISIVPIESTTLFILGGHDLGDSDSAIVEGAGSSWLFTRSHHPINVSASVGYTSQNAVLSGQADLQMVVLNRENFLLLAGGGGAIFRGGSIPKQVFQNTNGILTEMGHRNFNGGEGGPVLSIYFPRWQVGLSAEGGVLGGTGSGAQGYGDFSVFKRLEWTGW